MREDIIMKKIGLTLLKETLIQFIISAILMAIAAFIVLQLSPSHYIIKGIIIGIYVISTFTGGMIMGKVMENRKFLWGMLAGIVYVCIIMAVSLIANKGLNQGDIGIVSAVSSCILGGTLGGMVS